MSDSPSPNEPVMDDDLLAAEHALGVGSAEDRALADLRRSRDPIFDHAVIAWEERLAPLAAAIAPVEPSSAVWPRIENRIVVRDGLLDRVGFWRGATAASLALAAASLVVMVMPKAPAPAPAPPPPAAPAPVLTGFIRPEPGKTGPIVSATLDRARGELILTAASLNIEAGKDAELWVIQGDDVRSLGVIAEGQERRMPLPAAFTGSGERTSVLAITVEQIGGSPTGVAQGPVVATGGFQAS
jgi:anti-sigma-K factor RskA